MAILPVAKFAALAVKQIAKPIAKAITGRARNSPQFSSWIENIGHGLHKATTWTNRTALGLDPSHAPSNALTKEKAVANGSEFLSETILFSAAVLVTAWEYKTSNDKAMVAKREQADREAQLTERVRVLEEKLVKVNEQLAIAKPRPTSWF